MPDFPVATKMLKATANDKESDELLMEATILAQFDHKHIAYLVGVTTTERPLLMHMAYYEHGWPEKERKMNE